MLKLRLEPAMRPGTKAPARLGAATGRYARKKELAGPRAIVRRREADMATEVWGLVERRVGGELVGGRCGVGTDWGEGRELN